MAERKKPVRDNFGNTVEGTVVAVEESTEKFSEVRLEDGTTLRTKLTVLEVIRIDGQYDNDGNPAYSVRSTNIVAVSESPPELMRKVQ